MLSLCPQLLHHIEKSFLIDGADTLGGQFQGDPFVFFRKEKTFCLQIGQKPALGLDVRVRNIITADGNLACNLTYACHESKILECESKGKWQNEKVKMNLIY